MAKNRTKKQSKRVTCRKRYKIEKKVREHDRKVRKEDKKKAKRPNRPQTLTVPNKCPFKEEILLEAKQRKEQVEMEKTKLKEQQKKNKKNAKEKLVAQKRSGTLENLVADVSKKQQDFEIEQSIRDVSEIGKAEKSARPDPSLKAYAGEVRKVIEQADVIFEILDARDPLGSRCTLVEKTIIGAGKRLILVINKIDLVPKENVQQWVKYLRKELPTIAFKASTQEQKFNLGRAGTNLNTISSKCIGADLVMKLLGNYCRNNDIKTSIRVGIIGYPNVGKSSVINSLKRKRTCNVGATPGITKSIQEVELSKHIRLLDSPGVVLVSNKDLDPVEVALKNAVRPENLPDPVAPVQAILRRCSKDMLMLQYNIPEFDDCDSFLALMARKIGRLKKGARPDVNAAARKVLTDWNSGKLRYYTLAPDGTVETTGENAQLLTEMSKEFNLDDIDKEQEMLVEELPTNSLMDECILNSEEPDAEMDLLDDEQVPTTIVVPPEIKSNKEVIIDKVDIEMTLDGNQQVNKEIKSLKKRQKRSKAKTSKRADKLADTLETAMELGENAYDFDIL